MLFPYMISVQWGQGHHYFQTGAYTMQEAAKLAKGVYDDCEVRYNRHKKANCQPRVMIWELRQSEQAETNPLIWMIQK